MAEAANDWQCPLSQSLGSTLNSASEDLIKLVRFHSDSMALIQIIRVTRNFIGDNIMVSLAHRMDS